MYRIVCGTCLTFFGGVEIHCYSPRRFKDFLHVEPDPKGKMIQFDLTHIFQLGGKKTTNYPPKISMSPGKGPFQKERLVFQPAFFGEYLSQGNLFQFCSHMIGMAMALVPLPSYRHGVL